MVAVTTSYPGVYVTEVPSGYRTISGAATSVAAFVGRTRRGPAEKPVVVNSYADFQRTFGGIWTESSVSYAVRDFFANGGGQAVVVRLVNGAAAAGWSLAADPACPLRIVAAEPGTWAKTLEISIDYVDAKLERAEADAVAAQAASDRAAADIATATAASDKAVAAGLKADADVAAAHTALAEATATLGKATADLAAAKSDAAKSKAEQAKSDATAAQSKATTDKTNAETAKSTAVADQGKADEAKAKAEVAKATADSDKAGADATAAQAAAAANVAETLGVNADALFDVTVTENRVVLETFRNLTVVAGPRRIDGVLAEESRLIRADGTLPKGRPARQTEPLAATGGDDGSALLSTNYHDDAVDLATPHRGLYALDLTDFNLLCLPMPDAPTSYLAAVYGPALKYCVRRRAVLIVDPPPRAAAFQPVEDALAALDALRLVGDGTRNAAFYYPRIRQADESAQGRLNTFVASGTLAGLIARTDATRGVWKAPAGVDASLLGVADLEVALTDAEVGRLNGRGVNVLRTFPGVGPVSWGARTMRGGDQFGDEYRYLPVRRLALHIEESLFRGTQWVVFEPNDEPLWAQIRLNVGAFMNSLFRQGAFAGATSREAYFVKCDSANNPEDEVGAGRVSIHVGFAPLRPAEFVMLQIQQIAQA
ncbi:phage tail sheath family protein [Cryptosporangium sp. NPDC051539]|uniref:phage tail sheath family protein n=1 Tax=Cryptosporangium sp. NPDC051539 TaxID=3363962 RepID=UPI00378D334A